MRRLEQEREAKLKQQRAQRHAKAKESRLNTLNTLKAKATALSALNGLQTAADGDKGSGAVLFNMAMRPDEPNPD